MECNSVPCQCSNAAFGSDGCFSNVVPPCGHDCVCAMHVLYVYVPGIQDNVISVTFRIPAAVDLDVLMLTHTQLIFQVC